MVHKWYKYTINKRIIKRNNDKMGEKKNRYSIVYYNGFVIDCISLLVMVYFPTQSVLCAYNTLIINICLCVKIPSGNKRGTKIRIPKERKTIKPLPEKRVELQETRFVPRNYFALSLLVPRIAS